MKVGVLTSSRADFGIYLPLLKKFRPDARFELEIIAFGTHTSPFHGYTIDEIQNQGFEVAHRLVTTLTGDDKNSISTSYALTVMKFADFWNANIYDLVFCLGDRYEMNAAVQAGIPFEVNFAHLHGGETTLGAIDDIYRHQISLASSYHFTCTREHAARVKSLVGDAALVEAVGALSLEGLDKLELPTDENVRKSYQIPEGPYVLITFHPETVSSSRNEELSEEMYSALERLLHHINLVITLPNADTQGSLFRKKQQQLKSRYPNRVVLVENFGKQNYFAAMRDSSFLLGNTSSGIIEAASFKKHVVNVGDRQKGRTRSENVTESEFSADAIYDRSLETMKKGLYEGKNVYRQAGTADRIIEILKNI